MRRISARTARRILIPFAIVVFAVTLGTVVLGRAHVKANSDAMANPGIELTASTSSTGLTSIQRGRTLFEENCSSCHGAYAQGSDIAPNLRGKGPGVVDLWLSTGWMPLAEPTAQPENKPPKFDQRQITDIANFVSSLAPGGVYPPSSAELNLKRADVSEGFSLFSLNCAPCHTITGAGDALANGYHAPPLHGVTASEIYEAVRSGPSNMPAFGPSQITQKQLQGIMAYVTQYIQHPVNPGGLGLGGVGPVAEGFIGLFIGTGACLAAAFWVGDRTAREDEDEHGGHGEGDPAGDGTGEGLSGLEGAHA